MDKEMLEMKSKLLLKAGPLFLILFIDGMGLGIVLPILSGLIFDPNSHFIAQQRLNPLLHHSIYGAIIGIFMLCWFFGAALLGDLSDKIGRKPALLICLAGSFLSYLISAIAIPWHSLSLLLIGRIIAGITSGSQPIAQAAIIDLSTEQTKTRNLGFILLSLSLGFIVGPLIGGLLTDQHLVAWFDYTTPFIFAAAISAINLILLWFLYHDNFNAPHTRFSLNPYQAIHILHAAFIEKKIRLLSLIFLLFIFGWSSFYSFIALYLLDTFGYNTTMISLYMAVMGIGFGIGNGYLANFFAKRYPLKTNYMASIMVAAILCFILVYSNNRAIIWYSLIPMTSCVSIAYTAILTLFSNQVEQARQGWVMGVTGAIMAFVWGINGICIGFIASWHSAWPIYIAAFCMWLSGLTCHYFHEQ
jgi:MFS transporter, DHA1 family, tetracycline resistance protein